MKITKKRVAIVGSGLVGATTAFSLETQYFPNSINEPNFLTPITKAGETFETKTLYKFTVE